MSKEADLLESERAMLMELENNAKTEASKRKQAGKKLHSLLQSEDPVFKEEIKDHAGLKLEHSTLPLNLKNHKDENLIGIFDELNNHLESIQGNISQVGVIIQAMTRSRAAIQDVLFENLETKQYEHVILG
jgi:hypothetical protein